MLKNVYGLFIVLLTALAGAGYGQEVRTTVSGIVTDPSGAPIAAARVTITNKSSNASIAAESNATGNYV